jgi:hypothetical protein
LIWIKRLCASRMALDGDATVRVTHSTYTVTAMLLPFAHS